VPAIGQGATSGVRPATLLASLERLREARGAAALRRKLALLKQLRLARLRTARQVQQLHELLCFLRAYPDDARLLVLVEGMLLHFDRRADLRGHRDALAHTGIAGTTLWFPFFWPTARWVAGRWPGLLRFDRNDDEAEKSLVNALPLLVTPTEAAALRELKLPGYAAIDRIRPRGKSDATFLVERVANMPGDDFTREAFYDAINPSCELLPAADTPARGREKFTAAPVVCHDAPLRRDRPDLRAEMQSPPRSVRRLSARLGAQLVDLARGAMATRRRDLDAFAYGNARDAWLVDDGGGLAFGFIGVQPGRRAPIAAIYGGLTLRNAVPIGYIQADVVGRTAALSFNTFDTFRGGEAAFSLARLLAALRHVFGVDAFSIEPYQLGQGNEEGIASGAWWFYFKLGFRPRAPAAQRLVSAETARLQGHPQHRSTPATLRALAAFHLYFDFDKASRTPLPPLAAIGERVSRLLASLADDREQALAQSVVQARQVLRVFSWRDLTPVERRIFATWSPLVRLLRASRWPPADRRALRELIRAKAETSERDYVARLAAHARLRRVLFGQR
jgi:hypothetical protein